eukprot:12899346-Prorocentrum_lima.AAC.1
MKEESIMEAINPGRKMEDYENELWTESIRAELKSFEDLEVFDAVTPGESNEEKGSHPKRLPARLIL